MNDNLAKSKSFRYLDDLIHSGLKEIALDCDIILDDGEEEKYGCGIRLDIEGMVIDGRGHSIDANHKTLIFHIIADNIVLKNITFKNGFSEFGGAIFNSRYILTVCDSNFMHNRAPYGGAIYNLGCLKIVNTTLSNNESTNNGGAIYNTCILIMEGVSLLNNSSGNCGGAIDSNQDASFKIKDSIFSHNGARWRGGAIYISRGMMDVFSVNDSELVKNREVRGGVMNPDNPELNLENCRFENNSPDDVYDEYHFVR
jgi:predicted outer membrane repeat protein